ncbi:MAG: 30S ribosomal protein S11 [bacterium ADurb.Bin400]|nr:MAG: 30S ribosomal protein S11 [bacterium ADurb.Bin400]
MPKAVKKKDEKKTVRRKIRKVVGTGKVFIQSSFNNTIVTITDSTGGVIAWSSAGSIGFKGTKKSTPYAAQLAAAAAIEKAKATGLSSAVVFVSGVGSGRESAVRALTNSDMEIISIKDITPIPHNGCRPKKPRRV